MWAQQIQKEQVREVVSGMERLSLRASEMINHPIAQLQRWVTIHRLDTDGDREWEEVVGLLSETDDLDITLDDDGAVTVRWKAQAGEDSPVGVADFEEDAELAPF